MVSARDAEDVAVILLAAGGSTRMGGVEKTWADVGGRPLLAWSLGVLGALEGVRRVVAVAPRDRHDAIRALARECGGTPEVVCVEGGARRQDSVAAGVAAAPEAAWYLVHDAARPLVTVEVARRVLWAARAGGAETGAAVPGLRVVDTIKQVDGAGRIDATLDRAALRAVQTPQGFAGPLLRRALREVTEDVTDCASMVERLGFSPVVVEGDPSNLKVTTPGDLQLVRALAAMRAAERGTRDGGGIGAGA